LLEDLNEMARLDERGMGAGVEPGEPAAAHFDEQIATLHIGTVDVGDLELSAGRRFQRESDLDDVVIVEIETGHRDIRFRVGGLLFYGDGPFLSVKLDHAVILRRAGNVTEDMGHAS